MTTPPDPTGVRRLEDVELGDASEWAISARRSTVGATAEQHRMWMAGPGALFANAMIVLLPRLIAEIRQLRAAAVRVAELERVVDRARELIAHDDDGPFGESCIQLAMAVEALDARRSKGDE